MIALLVQAAGIPQADVHTDCVPLSQATTMLMPQAHALCGVAPADSASAASPSPSCSSRHASRSSSRRASGGVDAASDTLPAVADKGITSCSRRPEFNSKLQQSLPSSDAGKYGSSCNSSSGGLINGVSSPGAGGGSSNSGTPAKTLLTNAVPVKCNSHSGDTRHAVPVDLVSSSSPPAMPHSNSSHEHAVSAAAAAAVTTTSTAASSGQVRASAMGGGGGASAAATATDECVAAGAAGTATEQEAARAARVVRRAALMAAEAEEEAEAEREAAER